MSNTFLFAENELDDDYLDWDDEDNMVCNSRYVISSSSDEEADKLLETFRSKKYVKKAETVDDRDDFEKEMDSELSATLLKLKASFSKKPDPGLSASTSQIGTSDSGTENPKKTEVAKESDEFYDAIYFDSDDSDNEESSNNPPRPGSKKDKQRILSNDELLYDPKMDDRDQAWMDNMRRSYQVKNKKGISGHQRKTGNSMQLPESDAVLNCPACLTMLCMDCQRHEIYRTQYRAMFVFNCNVDRTELLKFPNKKQKKKNYFRNKKLKKMVEMPISDETPTSPQADIVGDAQSSSKDDVSKTDHSKEENPVLMDTCKIQVSGQELERSQQSSVAPTESSSCSNGKASNEEELFHPVSCKICNTKVAVFDKDEVYHFFNVVTSY